MLSRSRTKSDKSGERFGPRRRRRSPIGWILLVPVVLAFALAISDDDLRERAISLFDREPGVTTFPLPARYSDSFDNDWGAARTQGRHEGTDIFAPQGTPVYSVTSGTVTTSFGSGDDGWNALGGYTVTVRADRDSGPVRRGDWLYYAHLSRPTPLEEGDHVEAGERIGTVGRTEGQTPGSLGDFPPHLHLGWYGGFGGFFGGERDQATADSGAINPYPLLRGVLAE